MPSKCNLLAIIIFIHTSLNVSGQDLEGQTLTTPGYWHPILSLNLWQQFYTEPLYTIFLPPSQSFLTLFSMLLVA